MQLLMTKQHLARHHQMLRRMQCKYLPARSATRIHTSEVHSGTQWYSEVLRGTPTPSDALARNASTAPSGERRRRAAEAASEFVRFMLDLMG